MAREETVVETVKLTDGRTSDFPGKRKLNVASEEREDGQVVLVLDFRNGETRTFIPRGDMYTKYVAHGAEQKLRDEIAGEQDLDDGVLAIDQLIERLDGGEWNVKREAGGMSGTSILLRALVEYTGKTIDEVKVLLKDVSHAEKMSLRVFDKANDKGVSLKSIVDRLEAEKASKTAKVDVSEVMSRFAPAAA